MIGQFLSSAKRQVDACLRQGLSPQRLALTLALGFAIGCNPAVGTTTAACAVLAIVFRLNLPVIQAANYAAMPLQILLIAPFARLGRWLFTLAPGRSLGGGWTYTGHFSHAPLAALSQLGWMAGQALAGWFFIAVPTAALLTLLLTRLLKRTEAFAAAGIAESRLVCKP